MSCNLDSTLLGGDNQMYELRHAPVDNAQHWDPQHGRT